MSKDTWIEIVVGVVMLGGLGYLASRVMDMSQQLGSVDSKVSLTSERLDRIAQALPDVGVRVAYEEMRKPIRTLVISSKPVEKSKGAYSYTVSVIDLQAKKTWKIPVESTSTKDTQVIGALAWAAAEIDPQYASVTRMQEYARVAKLEGQVPTFINASASFILRETSGEELLENAPWISGVQANKVQYIVGSDWESLVRSMNENEVQLSPH